MWVLTVGTLTGRPNSISYSDENSGWPSTIRQMSQLVPPMSTTSAFGAPAARATWAPPIAPPAIPESRMCDGLRPASSASAWPPLDLRIDQRSPAPCSLKAFETPST